MSISRRDLAIAILGSGAVPAARGAAAAPQSSTPTVSPETVAGRVRSALQERLREAFDGFVDKASVADLYFLTTTLDIHSGESFGADRQPQELVLPAAFQSQIDDGVPCFVAVPEHLQADVERYVKMLIAEGGRA